MERDAKETTGNALGFVIDEDYIKDAYKRLGEKHERNYQFFRRVRNWSVAGALAVSGIIGISKGVFDEPKAALAAEVLADCLLVGSALGFGYRTYEENQMRPSVEEGWASDPE